MKPLTPFFGLFTILLLGHPTIAAEPAFGYPPRVTVEEIRQRLDKIAPGHPRLLANAKELAELRGSLDTDPLRRVAADGVLREAKLMLDLPPIERTLQGRRLLGESRRCLKRTVTLSMAYHLSGDTAFADRCKKEMLAVARFTDWNPSHFLDVAEMTLAMAIGYDWLYDQLDEPSREEIRKAIVEKGVSLPFETRHRGWVRARNNWGQVCHAGLTAGALAVMDHHPDLAAKTVHNALENVTHSMAVYAPNGSYPEGPGYWAYGTGFNVVLIGILESVLGTDFGLCQAPGFNLTGQYPALVTGPSGLTFNYADGGAGRSADATVFWFASRYDRPDWLLGEADRMRAAAASVSRGSAAGGGGRLLPLALLWMKNVTEQPAVHMPLHWQSESHTPISTHRSSWTDPAATFLGLKAGSPSGPHGQMDTGSFVLDADGVRWAVDLGAEGYHGIESRGMNLWSSAQNSERWTIFRQNNHGHNTLVIDGQLQHARGHASITHFSDDPEFPCSVMDMSPVYEGQAKSVRRGVALLPSREVLVQDQLTGLKPGSRVRWGMITPGKASAAGNSDIVLAQGSARLTLHILAPEASVWQIIETAKPRNEWDSPNPGTCMVAFEAVAPDSGELTLVVLATPGSCKASERVGLQIRPLEQWAQ